MTRPSLFLALVLAGPALASEPFLASEVVDALELKQVPASISAPAWKQAKAKTFRLGAQRAVRLNDKKANEALAASAPVELTVRAAHSGSELALLLEWSDSTQSLSSKTETDRFGDAVAVQLPVLFGEPHRLPHIGMGDEDSRVFVYLQRAAEAGPISRAFVAAGYGSLTRSGAVSARTSMEYDAAARRWRALWVRPLVDGAHSLSQGLVPIAFACWDGAQSERGGNKHLSSWKYLRLAKYPLSEAYLARVAWGFGPGQLGDASRGKATFGTVCIACHRTNDYAVAPMDLGPDLTDIGAIATPGYLRDSISRPGDLVVGHLNPNRHYDKSAAQDASGAYPNSAGLTWYTRGGDGKRASKMPPFGHLTPRDVADLVAYLRSLDGSKRGTR